MVECESKIRSFLERRLLFWGVTIYLPLYFTLYLSSIQTMTTHLPYLLEKGCTLHMHTPGRTVASRGDRSKVQRSNAPTTIYAFDQRCAGRRENVYCRDHRNIFIPNNNEKRGTTKRDNTRAIAKWRETLTNHTNELGNSDV